LQPSCSAFPSDLSWCITSAGSGSLIALGLIRIFRLSPYRVVGTAIFHAAILLWAAAIAHVVAGNVDYRLAGTILIGSVPGVWLGSHLSVRLPAGTLRTVAGGRADWSSDGAWRKGRIADSDLGLAVVPCLMAVIILVDRFRKPGSPYGGRHQPAGMSGH
jgi:hypothetical protein